MYWACILTIVCPNLNSGQKIGCFLEEAGIPYKAHVINILKGEQFTEEFLKISVRHPLLQVFVILIRLKGKKRALMQAALFLLFSLIARPSQTSDLIYAFLT